MIPPPQDPLEPTLLFIAALYSFRVLTSEDLVEWAVGQLDKGRDSPSLIELAGEISPRMSEVAPLFEKAMGELGVSIPSEEQAIREVRRFYAGHILSGKITPYDGAVRIERVIEEGMLFAILEEIDNLPNQCRDVKEANRMRDYYDEVLMNYAREALQGEDGED